MIARLAGRIVEKEPHRILVDVGGLGYRVGIPLSTFYVLPAEGEDVVIRIHTHVKEDSLALYGFMSREEQDLFERLIEISGIGPRLALAILSGLPTADLIDAIEQEDAARLRGIPGVGPKTADRVVLEMRGRLGSMRARRPGTRAAGDGSDRGVKGDVVSALVNLGYKESQAEEAVRRAIGSDGNDGGRARPAGGADAEALRDVLKRSLRYLAS